jgi:hypothetical protein
MTATAQRAEAYLRLMAETELRHAEAYPRYEPSQPPGLPPAAQAAVRLSRPALAPLLPSVRAAARMSGPLLGSLWPAGRTTVSAVRRSPVTRAAEPVLWRVLRVRQTVQPLLTGRGRFMEAPAEAGLDRVRRIADTLVSAGAISEAGAQEVLENLMGALVLRGKLRADRMYWPLGGGPWGPRPAVTPLPLTSGPVRAVPIETRLPLGAGGDQGEACLLALVTGPGRAVMTAAAWLTEPGFRPAGPGRRPSPSRPFDEITATDEHGTRYQADDTARLARGRWSVTFDLAPVPSPATTWLDITSPASTDPVRVELFRASGPLDTPAWAPAGSQAGLPAGLSPAERLLDGLAESLLAEAANGRTADDSRLSGLTGVVKALQAAAGLTTGSAALSRLAILAGRLGIEFPADLRPLVRPVELPEPWMSVLDNRGAADGPDRVAAVAAVLPEVDGARFALAGLDSIATSATLRTVGWGWEPRPLTFSGQPRYSWWARDDQGRWHVARPHGGTHGRGQADLLVEFGPALDPDARALEIIVRGPSSQAAMTVPLRWLVSR